jgi:2-methylisocitrate lyase-like PEP mutase family enzyme
VSLNDLASLVATIRERVSIPLIVDADTGFGNALNVGRSVRLLERAGADAIQLEDQVFPKKCGHMAGKAVIPADEAAGKIRAAVDAREHALISARTDALAIEGIDGAIRRASMYLDAGCDLLFIEGPRTMAEIQAISTHFAHRIPLVHNLVEGGITPVTTADALAPLNFALALHPLTMLIAYANAARPALEKLSGKKSDPTPVIGTLQDLNRIVDQE